MTPQKWSTPARLQGRQRRRVRPVRRGLHAGTPRRSTSRASKIKSFGPGEETISRTSSRPCGAANAKTSTPRSRKATVSTSICHAGNISYRLGRRASLEEQRKQLGEHCLLARDARALRQVPGRHRRRSRTLSTLGPWLECDAASECIKDNPKANELVKGFYRAPFVVPEIKNRQAVSGVREMGQVRV